MDLRVETVTADTEGVKGLNVRSQEIFCTNRFARGIDWWISWGRKKTCKVHRQRAWFRATIVNERELCMSSAGSSINHKRSLQRLRLGSELIDEPGEIESYVEPSDGPVHLEK